MQQKMADPRIITGWLIFGMHVSLLIYLQRKQHAIMQVHGLNDESNMQAFLQGVVSLPEVIDNDQSAELSLPVRTFIFRTSSDASLQYAPAYESDILSEKALLLMVRVLEWCKFMTVLQLCGFFLRIIVSLQTNTHLSIEWHILYLTPAVVFFVINPRVTKLMSMLSCMLYKDYDAMQKVLQQHNEVVQSVERVAATLTEGHGMQGISHDVAIARATECFNSIDANSNGAVSPTELRRALANLGCVFEDAPFRRVLRTIDVDSTGEIELDEFLYIFNASDSDLRKREVTSLTLDLKNTVVGNLLKRAMGDVKAIPKTLHLDGLAPGHRNIHALGSISGHQNPIENPTMSSPRSQRRSKGWALKKQYAAFLSHFKNEAAGA